MTSSIKFLCCKFYNNFFLIVTSLSRANSFRCKYFEYIYILCFKIFLILNSLSQSTTGRGPLQYIFRLFNSDTTQFHNKQQIINKPHVFLVKWNVILKKKNSCRVIYVKQRQSAWAPVPLSL